MVFSFAVELLFKSGDPGEVLLLFQQDSVTLEVCIFDSLLALVGQLLDSLFLLLIERNTLLLVL